MTNRKLLSFSLVIACSLFLLGCSGTGGGGGGNVNVNGTVVDLTFSPISNASVVIGSSTARTLSNGTYSFINIPGGDLKLTITSAGHTSSYRRVSVSSGQAATATIAILANLDSKITPIQASGGTATNTTGSIKMTFPSGAFPSPPQNVILTQVPKIAAPYPPPEINKFFSYIVYAYPDIALTATSELSISNTLEVTGEALPFYHFNPNSLVWDSIGTGTASASTESISIETTSMGWICAMIPNPNPGVIQGNVTDSSTHAPIPGANVWSDNFSTVSDSSGNYALNFIPTGVATVNASAVFYALYKSPPQTVNSSPATILNIALTSESSSQGNVTGTVRTSGGIPYKGAKVVGSNGGEAFTDSSGMYTLYNIPALLTDFTASALNYSISVETATVIGGHTINNVDFSITPVSPIIPYEFTLADGTMEGFTTEADAAGHDFWHVQAYSSLKDIFNSAHTVEATTVTPKVLLPDTGVIPIPYPKNHYFWYGETSTAGNPPSSEGSFIGFEQPNEFAVDYTGGTSLVGGTETTLGNSGSLISPPLNLAGYDYAELNFWTWWEIESVDPANGHDSMNIYISQSPFTTWEALGSLNPSQDPINGASWEAYTSGGFNQPGQWVNHVFDLSPYVGKTIKIKFKFDTVDFLYNGFRGWFLDDIQVNNSQFGVTATSNHRTTIPKVLPRNPR